MQQKRSLLKPVLAVLTLALLFGTGFTIGRAHRTDPVAEQIAAAVPPHTQLDGVSLTYLGQPLTPQPRLYSLSGRPFVACEGLFADCAAEEQAPDGVSLVSLLTAADTLGLCVSFDSVENRVDLYRAAPLPQAASAAGAADAYLRLEDIMAAGPADDRMGDLGLEKLRLQADTLHAAGQKFYVAWIPVYVDPPQQIVNDVTTMPSLYNASFVYTLDYLASRGGKIGAHGLTHQYQDERSSVGNEYGKKTPFTAKQQTVRFQLSQTLLLRLGYEPAFFEFPHYASTPKQEQACAQYFRVIYQQDAKAEPRGTVSVRTVGGREITYLPTPQDYVESAYARGDMIERIRQTEESTLVSLFFHPSLDYEDISWEVSAEGVKTYRYADSAFLPQLIACLRETGRSLAWYN